MKVSIKTLALFVFGSLIWAGVAAQESAPEQDEFQKIKVLEHPRYSLTDRFVFDVGFSYLPLDAYYKPALVEASVAYQPTDLFSWDMIRFGYKMYNQDTGLKASVEAQTGRTLIDPTIRTFKYRLASHGYLNLLYSKSNFFNMQTVYHQWQIGGGPSFYHMKHNQYGVDLAFRVRFFVNDSFLLNLFGGHTIGFSSKAPRQILSFGLGGGFAF